MIYLPFKNGLTKEESLIPTVFNVHSIDHQAKDCYLEDGRLGVLVDGHDCLAVLHARQVLDGPTDAHSDVQLWGHDLAGLAHLHSKGLRGNKWQ